MRSIEHINISHYLHSFRVSRNWLTVPYEYRCVPSLISTQTESFEESRLTVTTGVQVFESATEMMTASKQNEMK